MDADAPRKKFAPGEFTDYLGPPDSWPTKGMRPTQTLPFQPLLDTKQTAAALGVSYLRLLEMVREGILPTDCIVRLGKSLKFRPERLRAFVESGGKRERRDAA
jgi:hypothetical protein